MSWCIQEAKNHFEIEGFFSAIRFSWDEHFHFNGESHDFWEIVFVSEGLVTVTEDEQVFTLEKNHMILHAPLEFHRIGSAGGTTPTGLITSFRASGKLPEGLSKGVFALSEEDAEAYRAIFDRIYAFYSKKTDDEYAGQEASALLSAFLIRLGKERSFSSPTVSHEPGAEEYRRAVLAMSAAVCDNASLSDIAATCNVSVSYLKQLFHRYTGISPKSFYNKLRIQ